MSDEFTEDLTGKAATPANNHPLKMDKGKKLGEVKHKVFHSSVAKSSFLTMRVRPDILAGCCIFVHMGKEDHHP